MSDFLNELLAKFSLSNKVNVGVSISQNVGLEMIVVDPGNHQVLKYANRPLEYNPQTREIEDFNSFRIVLNELFQELKILPSKANVVLNLPNVFFGHTFLPTVLDDEGVTTALTSDVEQNYIFKKNPPIVSWVEVNANNKSDNRYILFSAVQESMVNNIKQVFEELGANLLAIENTNSSLIKALEFTEITKGLVAGDPNWNILLISQNSYSVFSMLEHNVIEYFEDPMAIKAFNGDEVYVAISQAASAVLAKYPTEKLLIISETNDVSAEALALHMSGQRANVVFLECNKFAKQPIMDVNLNILPNYQNAITPESIGAAIYTARNWALQLNFLSSEKKAAPDSVTFELMGKEIEMSGDQILIYGVIIAAIVGGLCFAGQKMVSGIGATFASQKGQNEQEIATLNEQLNKLQKDKNKIDIYAAAKQIDKTTKNKVLYFSALGAEIPAKVWINTFIGEGNDAYKISGQTVSVNDLYLFYRSVKALVPGSDLILSELKVDDMGGAIDIEKDSNAQYTFSLTNPAYAAMLAKAAEEAAKLLENPDGEGGEPEAKGGLSIPKLQDLTSF